jgi:hypothetical protein
VESLQNVTTTTKLSNSRTPKISPPGTKASGSTTSEQRNEIENTTSGWRSEIGGWKSELASHVKIG